MISIGLGNAKSRRSLATTILVLLGCGLVSNAFATICSGPIVLNDVSIKNATFEEAVEYIRTKSRVDDKFERDPAKRGINIVVMPPLSLIAQFARITLDVKEIRLNDLVELVGQSFQMKVSIEPYAVVYKLPDRKMLTRIYSVPPIFRSISTKKK